MSTVFLCIFLKLATFHPVHVSYTSVDIIMEKGEVMVTHKFYTDDLRLLFYHVYGREVLLDKDKEISPDDQATLVQYLSDAFIIKEKDDRSVKFEFMHKEQNEESVWLYFNGKLKGVNHGTIVIINTLLLDLFEDQTNLIILTSDRPEKGYRFDYRTREQVIDLKE